MIESAANLSSLPCGLITTRILKANHINLDDFSPISLKQCYDSKTLIGMGYVRFEKSWSLKVEGDTYVISKPDISTYIPSFSFSGLVLEKLSDLETNVDELTDLLVATHFQM